VFRVWLFIAGLSGCASLIAATYGAHGLNGATTFSASVKIYDTASLQHALHSIAIAVTAVLLIATEGRRNAFGTVVLNIAALAFLAGIILFSGLLYYQIVRGVQDYMRFVPVGGSLLMAGWLALALSAFGIRRTP
jgi:uncharacterized membrane protein YgdD (TMEM256/DUF423 family)